MMNITISISYLGQGGMAGLMTGWVVWISPTLAHQPQERAEAFQMAGSSPPYLPSMIASILWQLL